MEKLIGIYDADGGVVGELRYVIGHLRGTAECSLCDITHGKVKRKSEWDRCVNGRSLDVELLHRNELTDAQRAAATELPCVLIETPAGIELLIGADQLRDCHGHVEAFGTMIDVALQQFRAKHMATPTAETHTATTPTAATVIPG
jgi:acyl CoA:acetate/3-ketoacid CoA transferase alpha subunit